MNDRMMRRVWKTFWMRKKKNCPSNEKITLSSSHFFRAKRRWTICLIFFFCFSNNSLSFQLPPKPKKADLESKLDFEAKFHVVTCHAFFTPLWPHPSLLSNQHHHGLVLIKLFTKNLHDNFEKIYLRTTLIWCHTM